MDAVTPLREFYSPNRASKDLRRDSEARIWERRPRKRLTRTRAGVLYETVEVSDDELPEFIRGRR